jgi:hypothetical protein
MVGELLEGIPDVIYKYRDYDNKWNRKTLFDFELYLPSMSQFNDPFEGQLPFTYKSEDLTPEKIFLKLIETGKQMHPEWTEEELHHNAYERQREDLMNDDKHLANVDKLLVDSVESSYGVLSLAEYSRNYLMWSHYASSHTGFAIGFDTKIIMNVSGGVLGKVIYSDKFPEMPMFGDISKLADFHSLICTKSTVWEYEQEVRITKHGWAKSTVHYPKEMIKEIILGVKMRQERKDEIIAFVVKEDIDCEIFELSLAKKKFELDSLRIY